MTVPARRVALSVAALLATAACSSAPEDPPIAPPAPAGTGIQQGLSLSALQADGWIVCWEGTYGSITPLASILQNCQTEYMMLACRANAATDTLTLAAADRRDVVTQVDAGDSTSHHVAGSVGWYHSQGWSWGFFPAGASLNRSSCDVASDLPEQRLCWHTGGGNLTGGFRCGSTTFLNADATWRRLVLVHD